MEIKIVKGEYIEANIYVLIKNGKALIIDAGAKVEKVIRAVGNNKVVAVLLTHGHYDHSLYACEYTKTFNCPIYIHKNGKQTISDPKRNYGETFYINDFSHFNFLDGDGDLTIAPFTIQYLSTPGHSECGMCYLIDDKLFAGDTLFDNGIGRTDLIGSDKAAMLTSLEKLSEIKFETAYSGHGEPSDYARQQRNISIHIRFLKRTL